MEASDETSKNFSEIAGATPTSDEVPAVPLTPTPNESATLRYVVKA